MPTNNEMLQAEVAERIRTRFNSALVSMKHFSAQNLPHPLWMMQVLGDIDHFRNVARAILPEEFISFILALHDYAYRELMAQWRAFKKEVFND